MENLPEDKSETWREFLPGPVQSIYSPQGQPSFSCLLYTSDAADERSSVDLGGRRIIKKKTTDDSLEGLAVTNKIQKHDEDILSESIYERRRIYMNA